MVSVIVPSYGGFESLGFPPADSMSKYQLGLAAHPSSTLSLSSVQSRSSSSSSGCFVRKRKVIDASKGLGGPPILRSPASSHSSSLCKPLYVDCSVEYELPNVPKVPKNSLPLLVIHPGYEPKIKKVLNKFHSEAASLATPTVVAGRKRDASSLSISEAPAITQHNNIHSSSSSSNPLQSQQAPPLYSTNLLSVKRNNAYQGDSSCYSGGLPASSQCSNESLSCNESPPSAKRSRPSSSSDWLRHQQQQQRRLCEQQQLKRYQQQQQLSVQQQQHLWNCCPPLIQQHSSWGCGSSNICTSSCCVSNKLWLQQQQQQLYAKQQQAYYQQQLLRSGSSSCPDCLSGKCLFTWNKENLSAYRC